MARSRPARASVLQWAGLFSAFPRKTHTYLKRHCFSQFNDYKVKAHIFWKTRNIKNCREKTNITFKHVATEMQGCVGASLLGLSVRLSSGCVATCPGWNTSLRRSLCLWSAVRQSPAACRRALRWLHALTRHVCVGLLWASLGV